MGAGPKALAIAAKRAAARADRWAVPDLVVIDEAGVAANWGGQAGYTDGSPALGTPPEKDIGFPYASDCWWSSNAAIDHWMLRLSWQSYLASRSEQGAPSLAEWVDRGRPQPSHGQWARYLNWVAERLGISPELGSVVEIGLDGPRWRLLLRTGDRERAIEGDALVLTGPGPPTQACPSQPQGDPRILDGRNYWLENRGLRELPGRADVCVIGSGETAAAIAVSLLEVLPEDSPIEIVSPHGVVYSRGESYEENHLFSDPTDWPILAEEHREEFVRRTDRAVFSIGAKAVLNNARNVRTKAGRVVDFKLLPGRVGIEIQYGATRKWSTYDYVISAIGFDPLWFISTMSADVRSRLEQAVGRPLVNADDAKVAIPRAIDDDLAVRGLEPRLHVPMLASFAQGPGFPNLSSLGLVSDRIIRPYCEPPAS